MTAHHSAEAGVSVVVKSVSKQFTAGGRRPGVQALESIDLEVAPSEFVSIVGASGCGKSTLLKLVAGLLQPTEGEISVGDEPVRGPFTNLGMVFQKDLLLDWRTALGNVLLQAEMRGIPASTLREPATDLLATVGLEGFEDLYPAQLSGGMRQRVAICRALLMRFPMLLMDEPFGSLDALTRDQLNVELGQLLGHRPTVLFVTHSIDEAVFLSDRVIVMTPRPGRIDTEMHIELPRPRTLKMRDTHEFDLYTSRVREVFVEQGVLHELKEGKGGRGGARGH